MPEPVADTRVRTVEEAFHDGRPHAALAHLGTALRDGADGELMSDAIAVLHRTHGIAAAGGALALAEAVGAPAATIDRYRTEFAAHTMQRLLPEVLGRVLFLALGEADDDANYDPERWPEGKPVRTREDMVSTVRYMAEHAEELEWAADRLDPASREVLTARLVYLVLDHRRARFGPSRDDLDRLSAAARRQLLVAERVRGLGYMDAVNERDFLYSHRFDLSPIGFPITLEASMFGVQATYQLQQYRSPDHPEARPREGDVVIDGGGYLGETALWLAHLVGESGRVRTFELERDALNVLRENLRANPELAGRISVDERALWNAAGEELSILVSGPGTTVQSPGSGDVSAAITQRVTTTTLDALVATGELERVDFIKLDIEGAEPEALVGATETLRRFRPRLALAAYHRFDDMWALMRQIDTLDLGYRFALAHFTPHHEETVLYAWVPEA